MKTGKLTNEQLQELVLNRLPKISPSTLVGASIGADCAWLNLGDKILVSSSDPITAGGKQSGTLAIHVSCNDIASCGIRPSGILFVIIAPPSANEEDITSIVDQASREASKLGVDIVGGHTEVNDTVKDFVVITTAFGIIDKSHPVPFGKAKVGDKLILTKTCGIEGSYIASIEHRSKLQGKVSEDLINEASSYNQLISVVNEGEIAGGIINSDFLKDERGFYYSSVNLMHDVTEGGVYGASYEMAHFSGIGITLDEAKIPVSEATSKICEVLGLDP
ncbi:MAG: AIR synthase, partial [Clostridiales bacterium]|nr:AIR synthase [Clostridiales bacterium]